MITLYVITLSGFCCIVIECDPLIAILKQLSLQKELDTIFLRYFTIDLHEKAKENLLNLNKRLTFGREKHLRIF